MSVLLRLPHLGVADESVLLVEWLAEEGSSVHAGQAVACVETLKASFEVECEHDGVLLRCLARAGERLPPLAPIGVVGAPGEELPAEAEEWLAREPAGLAPAADALPPSAPATWASPAGPAGIAPAARARARELGIDPATVPGSGPGGLVRVADVERAAQGGLAPAGEKGVLDPGFLAFLRSEGEAFGRLSSEFRLALYRRHGASIGAGAVLGPGTVLLAERLVLGERASFGRDCRVEARELAGGALVHFGPRCRVRCTRVRLGDNAFFAEDVDIGGGGALDPEAELTVGSHGFIGEGVHINPCRPVTIGDEVVISRGAALMTHSFGASVLCGYPNRFAGVAIGDGAQIGIGAVLFPGVSMGPGSILVSGSSLVGPVPGGRLFGGVPAVDLKAAATPLAPAEVQERARELVLEFARQLALRGFSVETTEEGGETRVFVRREGRTHVLRSGAEIRGDLAQPAAEELRVAVRFPPAAWDALPAELVGIDLSVPAIRGHAGPLTEAWREFLRKRGVRLHPRTWTYPGGWL